MKNGTLAVLACLVLAGCVSPDPRRQAYIAAHPELTVREKDSISQGLMCAGITQEAVRLIWGNPSAINQVNGGESEQWIYEGDGQFNGASDYVNFDKDGRVRNWQRVH